MQLQQSQIPQSNQIQSKIPKLIAKILSFTSSKGLETPSCFDSKWLDDLSDKSTSNDSDSEDLGGGSYLTKDNIFSDSIDELEVSVIIERSVKFLEFNESNLVVFMIYLDRILAKKFILSKRNVNRIVFTGLVLSHKFFDDNVYKNKDYAKIAGISSTELLKLELEFSDILEFNFFIEDEYFKVYTEKLRKLNI